MGTHLDTEQPPRPDTYRTRDYADAGPLQQEPRVGGETRGLRDRSQEMRDGQQCEKEPCSREIGSHSAAPSQSLSFGPGPDCNGGVPLHNLAAFTIE
jgi:hypothetical protein